MKIKSEDEILSDHDSSVRPRARLEMKIVNALIAQAEAEGCKLRIDEYEPYEEDYDFRTDVFDLDIANVRVFRGEDYLGWILLVFGNDGWDLISNYSTKLETFLAPVNELADELQA